MNIIFNTTGTGKGHRDGFNAQNLWPNQTTYVVFRIYYYTVNEYVVIVLDSKQVLPGIRYCGHLFSFKTRNIYTNDDYRHCVFSSKAAIISVSNLWHSIKRRQVTSKIIKRKTLSISQVHKTRFRQRRPCERPGQFRLLDPTSMAESVRQSSKNDHGFCKNGLTKNRSTHWLKRLWSEINLRDQRVTCL